MAETDPLDAANDSLFHKVIRHFLTTPAPRRGATDTGEPAEAPVPSHRDGDE